MNQKVVKCPMCSITKGEDCDLMVSKTGQKTLVCCCDRLEKATIKKGAVE